MEQILHKAKAISAELMELNLKNKLQETGKKQYETGRNREKQKNWSNISQNCHKAIPLTSSPYQRSSKVIRENSKKKKKKKLFPNWVGPPP